MSTTPQSAAPPKPALPHSSDEVRVYSHSNLFYWWPVWAIGFIMGLYTLWVDKHMMVVVPEGTKAVKVSELQYKVGTETTKSEDPRDILVLPTDAKSKDKGPLARERPELDEQPLQPRIHMAGNKNLGVLFCATLLLVIVITNVPLRGMWSVVVIITIALLAVILALLGWWEKIVNTLTLLDVRINAGGYFFISGVLCAMWATATFAFDRQTYIVFTPGQFKVCQSIGSGEEAHDTAGLTFTRQRGDFFRHYVLGLGSGDLIVQTTGARNLHYELPNVLFIGRKVQLIEELLRKRKVEASV